MKKSTLPALILAAAMLVACDVGTVAVPETTTRSSDTFTTVPTTDSPVLSADETVAAETTAPVTTEAPVTYPTIYQRPDISGNHSGIVPVETIVDFSHTGHSPFDFYFPGLELAHRPDFAEIKEYLDDLDLDSYGTPNYEIALVTPLEIAPNGDSYRIRLAVDAVYDVGIAQEYLNFFKDEMVVYCKSKDKDGGWVYNEDEITVTTTGGKYIMLLYIDTLCYYGEDPDDAYREILALPLTWELDMDSVPGSTGDNWNRPPFIGYAEDYYAFGFGDIWERYMAK